MRRILSVSFFLVILQACRMPVTAETNDSGEKILFLAYELTTDSLGAVNTRIINQIMSEGSFKAVEPIEAETDDVVIQFVDKKNTELKREIIRNPFVRQVESVNDEGRLIRVSSVQERAEITIRTKYLARMKKINLLRKGEPDIMLFTHDLNTN